ncbi:MAG: S9 family peptidase [Terriglobales bacterium]
MRSLRLALFLCPGFLLVAVAAPSPYARLYRDLTAVRQYPEVSIAPDGKTVAWVETLTDKNGEPSNRSAILLRDAAGSEAARHLSAAASGTTAEEHDLAWSPDSRQVAFLSDAAHPGQLDLYVVPAAGGAARQLTHLTGSLSDPKWSPDGRHLALLYIANAPRAAGPLAAMTPDSGVVEDHFFEQRLTTVELATGQVREVSPADLYVYEYDWSPDSTQFAASAAHGSGDNNWWVAELYTVNAQSGATRAIHKPSLQMAVPRWSPDGRSIAYIGGIMSDEGSTGGDVYLVPATGGTARDLTPHWKGTATWLTWMQDGRLLLGEDVDGSAAAGTLDPSSGLLSPLWNGAEVISAGQGISLAYAAKSANLTSAVIRTSFASPPEVWAGPVGAWRQLTDANAGHHPSWGKFERLHWMNDGQSVQGWLLYPRDYDPGRKYPMVVSVHGGPSAANLPGWPGAFFNSSSLSTAGFFVLYPNPRGSYGQGEAFTAANVKDFGYGDFRDILAGVDAVTAKLPVDPQRIGIMGWSYGGYMTMWAVTQTTRFKAAVAGAGLSDWLSYYGENDIDQWMIPFFGASVYNDPAVYARSSPITFIKNVHTPTLILGGDRDGEVPIPQSYEFWHALKSLGVKTQFVVYPNEGHRIGQPAHRRDIIERTVAWFEENLK